MLCGSQDISPVHRAHPRVSSVNTSVLRSQRHHIISSYSFRPGDNNDGGNGMASEGILLTFASQVMEMIHPLYAW